MVVIVVIFESKGFEARSKEKGSERIFSLETEIFVLEDTRQH